MIARGKGRFAWAVAVAIGFFSFGAALAAETADGMVRISCPSYHVEAKLTFEGDVAGWSVSPKNLTEMQFGGKIVTLEAYEVQGTLMKCKGERNGVPIFASRKAPSGLVECWIADEPAIAREFLCKKAPKPSPGSPAAPSPGRKGQGATKI